ncbi:hypothetical protein C2845_PM13G15240 [Panicum miliaceum]|uniref:Uncharacterized protein n=1 Tax=Panicum miliaceum TaxID=4540 RepID=A0A3L6RJU1_PANMI|nr:hypothetical protein C2845_PM13G15240 [Panicum miliaceum]
MQPLATELGIPRIAFSPSAVYGSAVLHSLVRRIPRPEEEDDESLIPFPEIPGVPVVAAVAAVPDAQGWRRGLGGWQAQLPLES